MSETIYRQAQGLYGQTVALRRWFHSHPEPSFREYATAQKVREELKALGIPYETVGETGTVGILRGAAEKPVVALRADIDALEIQEKNRVEYRSQNNGLMHACGHDAHAASLLAAARLLQSSQKQLQGTVKLIFQPAEEVGLGAQTLVDSGFLNDVDAFFGIHVQAGLPVGKVALKAGPAMAGANSLKIDVYGESGHAGRPNEGVDAIAAGAAIVEALQHIVSREISPVEPAVVSLCQFHAGTRDNITANHARISGTVRITTEQARTQVEKAIRRIVAGVGAAHRVKTEVECEFATLILSNAESLYPIAAAAAEQVLGPGAIEPLVPKLGTEDFSQYGKIAPSFFAFVGSGGEYPHHHERFDIQEEALAVSAALHTAFVFGFFKNYFEGNR
ncbi:MAG: M20 family metallopeptidase [Oscillospiraceae bacterium]